jgi:hypothetical protein
MLQHGGADFGAFECNLEHLQFSIVTSGNIERIWRYFVFPRYLFNLVGKMLPQLGIDSCFAIELFFWHKPIDDSSAG